MHPDESYPLTKAHAEGILSEVCVVTLFGVALYLGGLGVTGCRAFFRRSRATNRLAPVVEDSNGMGWDGIALIV